MKSFDSNDVQFAWDSSSLSNYERCPRYYQYVNLEGYTPIITSPHLFFGGLYAAALEQYFKALADGKSPEDATILVVHNALVETWEHERDEEDKRLPGTGSPWESLHNSKTRETLIRSIVWYLDHFSDDTMETVWLPDGTPAVEYSFALPLVEDIVYCGHIDRLVQYGDEIYVMDQKTSGTTIGPYFFRQFSPDIQMSGYTFAGKIIFELPVKGVVIDAAQIAVGFTRFERGFVHRTESHLDDWLTSTLANIARARADTAEGFFPMQRQSCGNYGGCQFRDVCGATPTQAKRILATDFTRQDRWDPLERR